MLSFYKNEDLKFEKTHNIDQDCWINIEHATTEDLEKLCQLIHTSITDLVDALDHHELPRMEKTGNFLLLFVRHPIEKTGHLHTISVTILLKDSYFITICPAKSPLIEEFLQRQAPPSSPSLLLIQFLQRISQEFSGQIKKARHSVMDQGKEMHAVDSEDIFSLTEHEEVLNQYLSSLGPLQSAMKDLLEVDWPLLHTNYRQEIDDLVNAIKQSETLCNVLIKNIRSLRDSYQIIFANKLTHTIKLLTGLTIIFSIPNMIASIYGMNVRLPLAAEAGAFFTILLLMFLLSALCGYWFYKKKWL